MRYLYAVILVSVNMLSNASFAQWLPDIRLTNNASSSNGSLSSQRYIAATGSVLHVVWSDQRDGNEEIYYKRSTDAGATWSADTRLTFNSSSSVCPSIAVAGNDLHLVWDDLRSGNLDIYYKHSSDGGLSWDADKRLTNNSSSSQHASIAANGSKIYVVWFDDRDVNRQVYYNHSDDGGVSWGEDTRLSDNVYISKDPSISVSGSTVHVIWEEFRVGNSDIYYRRSDDGGLNFTSEVILSDLETTRCSISSSGNFVHIAWEDVYTAKGHIIYKRSSDGGVSWGENVSLTGDYFSTYPFVLGVDTHVHIIWFDYRDGTNSEIYYRRSENTGLDWENEIRLTNNAARSEMGSLTVSGSTVHMVWQDNRDGNNEIYYKKDPTGNSSVGITNISTQTPDRFSLSQNYPNPFNPVTKFKFQVSQSNFVRVTVFDNMGREVETLVNENLNPGTYEASFEGSRYSSGVYYYKIMTKDFTETKKMLLLK